MGLGEFGVIESQMESASEELLIYIKLMRRQVFYGRALTLLRIFWLKDRVLAGALI